MITVIKNVNVYAPEKLGIKDIVIVSDKIEGIYDNVNVPNDFVNISIIDGKGKILFPGFLDSHVHIIGGGGHFCQMCTSWIWWRTTESIK